MYAVLGLSASGSFPSTTVGATSSITITVNNATSVGASSVSIGAVSAPFSLANNTCGATLGASSSCTFDVVFSPTSAGTSSQTVSVSYYDGSATQSSSLGVSATAGVSTLTLSPSGAFSTIIAGSSTSITITVNNATAYTASSVSVAALSAPYSVGSNTCGATVAAGANCTFAITFSPTAAGTFIDTATVNYSNGASATSATQALTATAGVASLSLSASGAFPNTTAGASNPITITVSNSSGYTASSVSVAALSAPYSVGSNLCAATIVSGGSCTFVVTFAPTAAGTFNDTATVNFSNGAGSTSATLALTATGGVSALSLGASGAFPSTTVGSSNPITITASNTSGYTASSVAVTALSAPFSVGSNLCGATIAAGGSCTFVVTFTPTGAGTFNDTANVGYSDGVSATSATLGLSATAVAAGGTLVLSVTDPSNNISTDTCAPVTVTSEDGSGNPLVVGVSTRVSLFGLGSGSAYSALSDCQTATSSVSEVFINIGEDHHTFYYRTAVQESLTLQATATSYTSAALAVNTVLFRVLGQTTGSAVKELDEGESGPHSVYSDGTRLFVADYANSRVLVWNTIPTTNGQTPSFVLGGPGTTPTASTMSSPSGVFSDGTRLFVADWGNHRVLIWSTMPTASTDLPDLVLGQANMTTGTSGSTLSKLYFPTTVYSDGTRLFVSDFMNQRVLEWTTMPTSNGQAANFKLNSTMSSVQGVSGDGTRLFVAESNRVLVWNATPTASTDAPNFALGQPDLTSNTNNYGGLSASSLNNPSTVHSDGTRLFVADTGNSRVLVWNAIPTTFNQASSFVLGQPNSTSNTANNGGISASRMNIPYGVYCAGTRLFVADASNNRTLIWNTVPTSTGQAASLVVGQPNTTSNQSNNAGQTASLMNLPRGVQSDGARVFVADTSNNRVLVWNTLPTSDGQAADVVLGQPNFTSITANNGGVSASSMSSPRWTYSDGTRLFVSDSGNNRVLVWNTMPTSSGQAASFALGQPDLVSNASNNGGLSASALSTPMGIFSDGTRLFVTDLSNNRILVWSTMPTANGQAANLALGQPNLVSNTANNGGISASALSSPYSVHGDGTRIFVADGGNSRVLIWTSIPSSSGQAANVVVGQSSFTAAAWGVSATKFSSPYAVYGDGTRLLISDYANHRVLVWNTIPATNGKAADVVLGQPDFTSSTLNNGGLSSTSLRTPYGVYSDGARAFVADSGNYRVLVFPLP